MSCKSVNIVNEEEKDEIIIYVGLKPRIDASIEFTFFHKSNDKEVNLSQNTVEAKAILIPDQIGGDLDDMELEEYEFDILWDSRKEKWVANLQRGNYLINLKDPAHKELNKIIQLDLTER